MKKTKKANRFPLVMLINVSIRHCLTIELKDGIELK